jgi:hypothetical protein
MTTIIIRAADTAQAFDEVRRRLGPDALILSTRQNRGLVEVEATTALAMAEKPAAPAPIGVFQHLLDQATGADGAASGAAVLPPDLTGRVVLFGLPGAGCSLLAARLAACALRTKGGAVPRLVAPRPDILTATGALAQWARLLGLTPHRPIWPDGLPAQMPPLTDPDILELVDLSDLPMPDPAQLRRLASLPDTQVWLVLPTGLHPRFHEQICPQWQGIARLIVLTRADVCAPTPDDLTLSGRFGLPVGLWAGGTGLLDALHLPMGQSQPELPTFMTPPPDRANQPKGTD